MQKKETWADLRRRARWDRIFGAFAVLILLLVLMISGIRSCAREAKEDAEPANIPAETVPQDTQPPTQAVTDNSMAVYLSPSTQEDNLYACDKSVTEEIAMWQIARRLKSMLEADGVVVYICGEDDSPVTKVEQGNDLKCGAYVALHSNSSGESGDGQGTECFYNSDIPGSLALSENIYNRVAALSPTEDRGIKDQYQRDLYEVNQNITPCCFLEVEFHDNVTTSQWILNHVEDISRGIADGIEAYLDSTRYNETAPATDGYAYPSTDYLAEGS